MTFSVKAEYAGHEFRRCTFDDLPSFEQLQSKIVAWYPITSPNFSLHKLLLSPDASKPAVRILLSQSVFNASDYNQAIAPYIRTRWENALLRFTVQDQSLRKLPSSVSLMNLRQKMLQQQQAQQKELHPAGPSSSFPRLPETLGFQPMTPGSPQSYRAPLLDNSPSNSLFSSFSRQTFAPVHPDADMYAKPTHYGRQSPQLGGPDCGANQSQVEIENLISKLKVDIQRIVERQGPAPSSACPCSTNTTTSSLQPTFGALPGLGTGPIHLPPISTPSMTPAQGTVYEPSYWSYPPAPQMLPNFMQPTAPFPPPSTLPPLPPQALQYNQNPPRQDYSAASTPTGQSGKSETHISRNGVSFAWGPPPAPPRNAGTTSAPDSQTPVQNTPAEEPSLPVHDRIICDFCNTTVVGVRHKCLDCADFDLCTACIGNGGAEAHNPFHEFFEINEPGHVIVHTIFAGEGEREAPRQGPARSPTPEIQQVEPTQVASDPVVHSATCDMCDGRILGIRYKCIACPDFDLCSQCFQIAPEQHPGHAFAKLRDPDDYLPRGPSEPQRFHFSNCDSCGNGIQGVRYKCTTCEDYDLCQNCEALPIPVHPASHTMLKIKSPFAPIPVLAQPNARADPFRPTSRASASDMYTSRASSPDIEEPEILRRLDTPPYDPGVEAICSGRLFSGTSSRLHIPTLFDPPSPDVSNPPSPSYRENSPPRLPPMEVLDFGTVEYSNPFIPHPESPDSIARYPVMIPHKQEEFEVASPNPSTPEWRPRLDDSMPRLPSPPSEPPVMTRPTYFPTVSELLGNSSRPSVLGDNGYRSVWDASPLTGEEVLLTRPTSVEVVRPQLVPADSDQTVKETNPFAFAKRRSLASLLNEPLPPVLPSVPEFKPAVVVPTAIVQAGATASTVKEPEPLQAAFLANVTVPDGQVLPPGAEFRKVWRLQNTGGSAAWPEDTQLVFVAGTNMSVDGNNVDPMDVGSVKPGENTDVSTADLKAPEAPGHYYSYWRLSSGQGNLFGQDFWIDLIVGETDGSDSSLSSSSVIMPQVTPHQPETVSSPRSSQYGPSSGTDAYSDAMSDVSSGISVGLSSDSDDWESVGGSPLQSPSSQVDQNLEYVMLFDEHDTESES
ncbi:hypothetical protein DL96DRAFT_1702560 [Flagelloscypha sp. PMI_526]|nr:hypothetical protein DL96DRAFT_1702560 [Flagelloscypha sp. PMI_526]